MRSTTGPRWRLDRHGHHLHRTSRVGELVEILAGVGLLPLLGVPDSAGTGHPEVPPDDPAPFGLVNTATGQRRHLDRHGRHPHRASRVGDLFEILASAGTAAAAGCAGHPEAPPGNPEPFSLVKSTTGPRWHLDRRGHTRTASAASASWSRSWPALARCRCWLCRTAPQHRGAERTTGRPHPVSLLTVTAAPSAPRPTGAKNAPIPLPCIYVEFPRFQMALASFSGWKWTAM